MWENVVREIFGKKSDILKEIFIVIDVIDDVLRNVLRIFYILIKDLKFIN